MARGKSSRVAAYTAKQQRWIKKKFKKPHKDPKDQRETSKAMAAAITKRVES